MIKVFKDFKVGDVVQIIYPCTYYDKYGIVENIIDHGSGNETIVIKLEGELAYFGESSSIKLINKNLKGFI